MRELYGLTPDTAGFVHIPAERHPVRFVAKGRDENRDECVIVITGVPEEAPSYLALSLDDARRLVKHLVRVLHEPPARMWWTIRIATVADERFARLPDQVTLTRDEVAVVLFALDVVEDVTVDPAEVSKVRQAVVLLTRKLWPELGDVLDGDN